MRILVLLAIGCGSSATPQPATGEPKRAGSSTPQQATGEPTDGDSTLLASPLVQCERAVATVDAVVKCDPALGPAFSAMRDAMADWGDAQKLKMAFDDEHERTHAARKNGAACAVFMFGTAKDPPTTSCTMGNASHVAQAKAYLAAYDAARAPVEPTGDATADAALQHLAKLRDEICACNTAECARAVDDRLMTEMKPLPKGASAAARRTASALLHDVGKCAEDRRFTR